MQERNTRLMACTCAGYWFWHRADGSVRSLGDPDFADRNPPPDVLAA
ncbi:hypothetical protein BSIN_3425 [Burkholderia singularis]|uniref:Uncharacterized protein n=1 Tax=Burkholderia singularis TaxID=1503053 RepID=A0A238H593_9BURK|nr:hypothetical protein BSIN_3425 [Burkholderia singularis]